MARKRRMKSNSSYTKLALKKLRKGMTYCGNSLSAITFYHNKVKSIVGIFR